MNKKQKKVLQRIIIATLLMIGLAFIEVEGYLEFALYMVPYLIIGILYSMVIVVQVLS